MGVTRGAILRIFMLSGVLMGLGGAAIGAVIGVATAAQVQVMGRFLYGHFRGSAVEGIAWFLAHLPSIVRPWQVAMIVGITLGLALLASLYPAWRAARLDPVEALRYE
jgi:lipoprotein-releasing system permease protein